MCTTNSKLLETTSNGLRVILVKFDYHKSGASPEMKQTSLLAIWLVLAFNFLKFLLQQTDFSLPHILAEYNEKKVVLWLLVGDIFYFAI